VSDEDTEIVQPDGGEDDIIVIRIPFADALSESITPWLVAELFAGAGFRFDVTSGVSRKWLNRRPGSPEVA
jgi:hypothetical protein